MTTNYCKSTKTYTVRGITSLEMDVICAVLKTADRRCFPERDENGNWYSNDDFVLLLEDNERKALAKAARQFNPLQ